MNKLLTLPTDMARSRGLTVILTANRARGGMTELIASLILRGPLFVVAASEWLPAFELTRLIRRHTRDIKKIHDRLRCARASTCYRLYDSLGGLSSQGEPILVLDFLHTFYDEDIDLRVRLFRLRECCRELKRLAFYRPVIVMTQQMPFQDYEKFLPALNSVADKTIFLEPEAELVKQPALF